MSLWIGEHIIHIIPYANNDDPWTKLGNTVVRGIEQLYVWTKAKAFQASEYVSAIAFELRVKQPTHVFNHHYPRVDFLYQSQHLRKEVTLIGCSQLAARYTEWRTRNPT